MRTYIMTLTRCRCFHRNDSLCNRRCDQIPTTLVRYRINGLTIYIEMSVMSLNSLQSRSSFNIVRNDFVRRPLSFIFVSSRLALRDLATNIFNNKPADLSRALMRKKSYAARHLTPRRLVLNGPCLHSS